MNTPVVLHLGDADLVGLICQAQNYLGATDEQSVRHMAALLVKLALANPKVVEALVNAHARYRDAEGFDGDDVMLLASRVSAQPEYREHMLRARLVDVE